jgi:hypothetical protein
VPASYLVGHSEHFGEIGLPPADPAPWRAEVFGQADPSRPNCLPGRGTADQSPKVFGESDQSWQNARQPASSPGSGREIPSTP